MQVVPGLAMLYGPVAGAGVLDLRSRDIDARLVLSIVAQAGLAAVLFTAATRKYRRPDGIALGSDLAMLLTGWWAVVSVAGAMMWEVVRPRWMGREDLSETQVIGSLVVGLFLLVLTSASVGRETGEAERRERLGAGDPEGAPRPARSAVQGLIAAALATMPVMIGMNLWAGTMGWVALLATGVAMLSLLVSVASVGRRCHRQTRSGRITVTVFVLLLVVLPILLETVLQAIYEPRGVGRTAGYLAQFSPLGLVVGAWGELVDSRELLLLTMPGALAQAALAGLLLWWSRGRVRVMAEPAVKPASGGSA
jgi:hypothetical protein